MAVKFEFIGQANQDIAVNTERGAEVAKRPQLKEWGPTIPLRDALMVFRVNEDRPGEAMEACKRFDGVDRGPSDPRIQQALAVYEEVEKALANDGRIDAKEAYSIISHGLNAPEVTNMLGGFAGGLVERFLGK